MFITCSAVVLETPLHLSKLAENRKCQNSKTPKLRKSRNSKTPKLGKAETRKRQNSEKPKLPKTARTTVPAVYDTLYCRVTRMFNFVYRKAFGRVDITACGDLTQLKPVG